MSKQMSMSEKILAEKTVCILLVRGEAPDGVALYAYVAVRVDKLEEFMDAQNSDSFYPEDYGVVIESGEGDPPAEVRERMERDYGFKHDKMLDIPSVKQATDLKEQILSISNGGDADGDN